MKKQQKIQVQDLKARKDVKGGGSHITKQPTGSQITGGAHGTTVGAHGTTGGAHGTTGGSTAPSSVYT